MAGSIPESGFAEGVAVEAAPAVRDRRWDALRRAARARLAPLGAVVVVLGTAVLASLWATRNEVEEEGPAPAEPAG